ncbi:aldose 1-epimerase [Naematelia encephala]|uniref:Aldose 1-epimerase n=1 Tax=Naematelia encephala TaxID=71784 RepID=A0A1Y2AUM2_9TREE|nr:aldose 1-epimerase [Naematelia encephala]
MRFFSSLPFLSAVLPASFLGNNDDAIKPLTISAQGINATFIGHGARLTHLFVNDRDEKPRDVVVGYDDPAQYLIDTATSRTFYGSIVGRYANRIKNGTFAIGHSTYHVPENEHGGLNSLHGGTLGYDGVNWTLAHHSKSSITYALLDPSGSEGFPGVLQTYVTYTVLANPARMTARIVSIPFDQATPAMLSTHIYWNIGAFSQPTVLNDTLHLPYANRIIEVDSLSIPTGALESLIYPWSDPVSPLNFTSPKTIGAGLSDQCGAGCHGIDNAFILDRPTFAAADDTTLPMLNWYSPDTGISMTVRTNQGSVQIYNCVGQDGSVGNKASQQQSGVKTVNKYGCLVIEPQQWIDGINHPEWGQLDKQIFGPDTGVMQNWAEYEFGAY